jgi:hypothetical protein
MGDAARAEKKAGFCASTLPVSSLRLFWLSGLFDYSNEVEQRPPVAA